MEGETVELRLTAPYAVFGNPVGEDIELITETVVFPVLIGLFVEPMKFIGFVDVNVVAVRVDWVLRFVVTVFEAAWLVTVVTRQLVVAFRSETIAAFVVILHLVGGGGAIVGIGFNGATVEISEFVMTF